MLVQTCRLLSKANSKAEGINSEQTSSDSPMGNCVATNKKGSSPCTDLERYKAEPWLCKKEIK